MLVSNSKSVADCILCVFLYYAERKAQRSLQTKKP